MNDYQIFGGCLRSEIAFPDLPGAEGMAPTWTLVRAPRQDVRGPLVALGAGEVAGGAVRLYRGPDGFLLDYHDTGRYHVSADGRHVAWMPGERADVEAARIDVTSRVLGVAMHAAGLLCLHGSAVALDGEAVTFLAPKHCGKSTLAMALVNAGARLVTDDTLAVELDRRALARPGVHNLRLWWDSFATVGPKAGEEAAFAGRKHVITDLAEERVARESLPLGAVYLLSPVTDAAPDVDAVRRTRLDTVQATLALVRHARNGDLLGGEEAVALFQRSAALAERVPVYLLELVRDFERLDEVLATLTSWHREPALHDASGSRVA